MNVFPTVDVFDAVVRLEIAEAEAFDLPFTFLQIGAHDGKTLDPIYPYSQAVGDWCGVCVEPNPSAMKRLRETYPSNIFPNVKLLQAAVMPFDGETTIYALKNPINPYHATMLTSVNRQVVEQGARDYGYVGEIEGITVPAITVETLLSQWPFGSGPDLLQIDTEGCDLDILRQFARLNALPKIIHYELWGWAKNDLSFLPAGYAIWQDGQDMLAYRQAPLRKQTDNSIEGLKAVKPA